MKAIVEQHLAKPTTPQRFQFNSLQLAVLNKPKDELMDAVADVVLKRVNSKLGFFVMGDHFEYDIINYKGEVTQHKSFTPKTQPIKKEDIVWL